MQHFPAIHFQEFLEQLEMLVFAFHYASFLAILQSNMMNVFIPISLHLHTRACGTTKYRP